MFFEDSRPDRKKRAMKLAGVDRARQLASSPVPPAKSYELFTPEQLNFGGDRTLIYDVESYINYWLVSFKCTVTKLVVFFEITAHGYSINGWPVTPEQWFSQLNYILFRFRIVGFNSRTYDLPMTFVALQGVQPPMLKQISDEIIKQDLQAYEVERKYCGKVPRANHIDLIEVAPLDGSLKLYGGRIHCERLQDLPYPEDSTLTDEQIAVVRDYNINDLDLTMLLWEQLEQQIKLREQLGSEYGVDLRSKSDAQIAETVIVSEIEKLGIKVSKPPETPVGTQFYYQPPDFISFKTPQFQRVLEVVRTTPFTVGAGGYADCPQEIAALKPRLGIGTYKLGAGGLHSSEESVCYQADADTLIIDRDVASFYPYIILNNGFCPKHLGEAFLTVYRAIVNRRIDAKNKAKAAKNKPKPEGMGHNGGPSLDEGLTEAELWAVVADSLKITINGTFGKLGNFWSKIYSPDLLIQVTMTGQLSLLMLIEMVELAAIPVVSANTDGIVIRCPKDRYTDLEQVVMTWEAITGFNTEETRYKGIFSRDVNNYIAVKLKEGKDAQGNQIWFDETDGCKTKGVFSEVGSALNSPLSKNPESYICSMAVQAFLEHGTPIEETVMNLGANVKAKHYKTPISRFVNVRTVRGGAEKNGVFLGKVVRWYYAKDERGCINYVQSGNMVPKSEGAKPLMNLDSGVPADLDFDRYINEANKMLFQIGLYRKAQTGSLF